VPERISFAGTEVPRIGLGCWAIGGPFYGGGNPLGYGDVSEDEASATIEAAWNGGVRLFDTAAVYGAGLSERRVGAALANLDGAVIVTKIGFHFDETSKEVTGQLETAEEVRPAVEACLSRLGRDTIDLVFLHLNTMEIDAARPVFEALEALQEEGLIRAHGWSTDFPDRAAAMTDLPGFQAVQHGVNVMADVPTITDQLVRDNIWALNRSPLAMGLLTGKYKVGDGVGENDVRANSFDWLAYFKDGIVQPEFVEMLEQVRALLQSDGRTMGQGALSWLLARSPRNIPIPGARSAAQAAENAGALEFPPLSTEVMAAIEAAINRPPEGAPRER